MEDGRRDGAGQGDAECVGAVRLVDKVLSFGILIGGNGVGAIVVRMEAGGAVHVGADTGELPCRGGIGGRVGLPVGQGGGGGQRHVFAAAVAVGAMIGAAVVGRRYVPAVLDVVSVGEGVM